MSYCKEALTGLRQPSGHRWCLRAENSLRMGEYWELYHMSI